MKVHEQSPEVAAMNDIYRLLADVMGGTQTMRAAGQLYLPKRRLEDTDDYNKRLAAACFFGAPESTMINLSGRVFTNTPVIDEKPWAEPLIENFDSAGTKFTVWAEELFRLGLTYGHAWGMVEAPEFAPGLSVAEQKRIGARPYGVLVNPRNVLGTTEVSGKLVQIRIKWSRQEQQEFGAKNIDQVRVYNKGAYKGEGGESQDAVTLSVYEERDTNDGKQWILVNGPTVLANLTEIPVIKAELSKKPPLLELAYLAIKHYQRDSSADSLMDTAEVPILAIRGEMKGNEVEIGAKSAIKLGPTGEAKFVEHTGAAIKAGQEYRQEIKEAMRQIGAKFTEPRNQTLKTATQAKEDAATDNSDLGNMCKMLQDSLNNILSTVAVFAGQSDAPTVTLKPNLKPAMDSTQMINSLLSLKNAEIVSAETVFQAAQSVDLVPDELTWEEEQARIGEAGSPTEPMQ